MKINEMKTLPAGCPIDGRITVIISKVDSKEGQYGPYSYGFIKDETGEIHFLAAGDWSEHEHQEVQIVNGGDSEFPGIKTATDKEGRIELKFGKKAWISSMGGPASASKGSTGSSGAIHGATVGMSINKAVDLFIADFSKSKLILKDIEPSDFNQLIYQKASDLVRIALHMEKGNLAPKDDFSAGDPPPAEEKKEEPAAEEPVDFQDLDDETPF